MADTCASHCPCPLLSRINTNSCTRESSTGATHTAFIRCSEGVDAGERAGAAALACAAVGLLGVAVDALPAAERAGGGRDKVRALGGIAAQTVAAVLGASAAAPCGVRVRIYVSSSQAIMDQETST